MAFVIDKDTAKDLIADYQAQNSGSNGPALLTPDDQFLKGFFISRRCLDAILSDNNTVGVSLFFAKHPDFQASTDNKFTIIVAGAESNPEYPDIPGAAPYVARYETWDQLMPCPPYCTELT